jgi:hypothetical protein
VPNDVVADDDKGACWWTMSSKHVGTWRNVPGTDRKDVSIDGVTFFWFTPEGQVRQRAIVENDVHGPHAPDRRHQDALRRLMSSGSIIIPRWVGARRPATGIPGSQRSLHPRVVSDTVSESQSLVEYGPPPYLPFDRVIVAAMPNPDLPTIPAWVGPRARAAGRRPEPSWPTRSIVGHSVGCQAVLRALAELPDGRPSRRRCCAWPAGSGLDSPWDTLLPPGSTPLST